MINISGPTGKPVRTVEVIWQYSIGVQPYGLRMWPACAWYGLFGQPLLYGPQFGVNVSAHISVREEYRESEYDVAPAGPTPVAPVVETGQAKRGSEPAIGFLARI